MFILGCGFTHLIGAVTFYYPVYIIGAVVNAITAIASVLTAIVSFKLAPQLSALKTPTEIEILNKRLTASIESANEAIISIDDEGLVIAWNKAAEIMIGYTTIEMMGKSITPIIPERYRNEHETAMKRLKAGGTPKIIGKTIKVFVLTKTGTEFPATSSLTRWKIDGQWFYTSRIRDITQEVMAENHINSLMMQVRQERDKIEELNKLLNTRIEALEAYNYSVSHDLNAPLRSMDGFSEILLQDYGDKLDEQGKDYLVRIRKASHRMSNLLADILRLSQLMNANNKLKVANISLTDMVKEILTDIAQIGQHEHEFIIQERIYAYGDAELIKMALYNLLSNAWKFSSKKPKIVIEFGLTKDGVFFIRDNGAGFDMSKADKLFKPFQRLHKQEDFAGNGIGLSIVKRVIDIHNGQIWADSKPNEGATFYFKIGVTDERAGQNI